MLFYRGRGSGDWWWSVSFIAGILAGRVVVHAIRRMVPVTPPVDGRRGPNAITLIIGRETEVRAAGITTQGASHYAHPEDRRRHHHQHHRARRPLVPTSVKPGGRRG